MTTGQQADDDINASRVRAIASLPFKVRVATAEGDLAELVAVRSRAYARHNAPGVANLRAAEEQDRSPDAILLVARSKFDNAILGSVRVQTRLLKPLMVESATVLPVQISSAAPVELLRGNVTSGNSGRMVSASLAKASFQVCIECGFTHIIVTCRQPVDLMYKAYQFDDLLAGDLIDLPYSPGAKHKVLCLPLHDAANRWRARNPGLLDFMLNTTHPDIEIDLSLINGLLKQAVPA